MTKVIRSSSGGIINIGDWDYQMEAVDTGLLNAEGSAIFKQVAKNPMPDGCYESIADIITGWDGGLYENEDPRSVSPTSE